MDGVRKVREVANANGWVWVLVEIEAEPSRQAPFGVSPGLPRKTGPKRGSERLQTLRPPLEDQQWNRKSCQLVVPLVVGSLKLRGNLRLRKGLLQQERHGNFLFHQHKVPMALLLEEALA